MKKEEISIHKRTIDEMICIFTRLGFFTLESFMRDWRDGRISEEDFQEKLLEWNTKVSYELLEEEEEGDSNRKRLRRTLVDVQGTFIPPGAIMSLSKGDRVELRGSISKKVYSIDLGPNEDDYHFYYETIEERDEAFDWLKEKLTYLGVNFN